MRWICLFYLMASCSAAEDSLALQRASVEKQLVSTRAQEAASAKNASFISPPSVPAAAELLVEPEPEPEPPCEPPSPGKIREIVDEGAKQSGLDKDLVRAVVRKESAYDPCAVSNKGAQGLMQLMPTTQAQFGVTNPYDPRQNVDAGTRLLKQLLDLYGGDISRALAAYNAGATRVKQFGGVPPFPETLNYVHGILAELPPK